MTDTTEAGCSLDTCTRPARMALGSRRTKSRDVISTIYYDDRTAPKTAQRYCQQHGSEMVREMVLTLTAMDEEAKPPEIKPSQHCTSDECDLTLSHTAEFCGKPQPRRCGCAFCYPVEP